ncbi:alpha/beta fold hydrolase [Sediminibacillus dalangtanensis]|uniref:Alpha/beta fold hydrolase n=1 Tax=Sediminibacillus dalangtanensis TaxID=2729421 RepID=A0ABX7VQ04_9BACI|nr:alpha/beta hydrolase [Sediminibacillus dalangtanensis]QTM98974.1 alpha/beta fold hydrolase [Sediminibacillus dalangtanensis]
MEKMIDIGSKQLEILDIGEGKPVVIQPGMACSIYEWENIARQLATHARVILFNRAGCGKSTLGYGLRNIEANVDDLYKVLEQLHISNPLLVGHSYGGLCMQHFAKAYPERICGLVLVDSSSVDYQLLDEVEIEDDENSNDAWRKKCAYYARLTSRELSNELTAWIEEVPEGVPPGKWRDFLCNPGLFKAMSEEIQSMPDDVVKIKSMGSFPEIPLTVIVRDTDLSVREMVEKEGLNDSDARDVEDIWQTIVFNQTKLTTNATFVRAKNASHDIHLDRPDLLVETTMAMLKEEGKWR